MYSIYVVMFILTGILIHSTSCQSKHSVSGSAEIAQNDGFDTLNFKALAEKITVQAALTPSESVLLVGQPGQFDPLLNHLVTLIRQTGAEYLGALSVSGNQPVHWSTPFIDKCQGKSKEELRKLLSEVDLGIMLPGASPDHIPYAVLQELLDQGIRRTIHFHWAGAYDLNGNLLPMTDDKDRFYQSVILETDYGLLAERQKDFEQAMRGQKVRVTSPGGTDIQFQIGDRPVTKQDGDASAQRAQKGRNLIDREIEIPSGAIRVAPLEETVNGTIAFPDALWHGEEVKGLKVTFRMGKAIELHAEKGKEAAEAEMKEAGQGGKSFREFALGFNPLMTLQDNPEPWIPYYGYGAGIVRLSLGDNRELGGNVGGGYVRWNFFPDASVWVGDEQWVMGGQMIK